MSIRAVADVEVSLPIMVIPTARKLMNKHFTGNSLVAEGKVTPVLKEALWMLYHAQKLRVDVLIHGDGTLEFSMKPTVMKPGYMTTELPHAVVGTTPPAQSSVM